MGITFIQHGSWDGFKDYLRSIKEKRYLKVLDPIAQKGVDALMAATPKKTGATAAAWYYKIEIGDEKTTIGFYNDHTVDGANIAILIQYGHSTGWGTYVRGRDYINPAIQPVFDQLADAAWKEVNKA